MRLVSVVAALALLAAAPAIPATPVEAPPLRVLVVTGGHDYPTSFYTLFEGNPQWTWTHAVSAREAFSRDVTETADVVVLYDMSKGLEDSARAHLLRFAESGRGLVVLHHALVNHPDWPLFEQIAGGRYLEQAEGTTPASTYRHDVDLVIEPVAGHPVTRELPELRFVDETYKGLRVARDVVPLLRCPHPSSDPLVGWVSPWPKARVVALQPGHGEPAHRDAAYRQLIRNAILWAGGRLR